MIIDCISDLHGHYPKLEGGDLLIVAGDLTARDENYQYIEFIGWLNNQAYKKIILIAGNHDNKIFDKDIIFDPRARVTYLCDSGTEFEYEEREPYDGRLVSNAMITSTKKLKIWGSPWTLAFPGMNPSCKAFTVETEDELAEKWALTPDDIDILITHSPPYDILDGVRRYGPFIHEREDRVGSKSLLIRSLDLKPLLHVFGHIHEQGGKQMALNRSVDGTENKTVYINASHVNERYEPVNKPIRVIL